MRIAQVVTLVSPDGAYGGPVRVAVNQLNALASLGHEVQLFATHRHYSAQPREIEGVPLTSYPAQTLIPKSGFAGLTSLPLLAHLQRALSDYDVVHVHLARDLVTLPAARLALSLGVPTVAQTHGMIDPSSNRLAAPLDAILTRPVLERLATVFYLTDRERVALEQVGRGRTNLRHLVNGVPAAKAIARPKDVSPEVLFLARLHPRKRAIHFVRAAITLSSEFPNTHFSLVGPDEGDGPEVAKLIERARCGHIRWEGALAPEETLNRMSRATIYALPSVDEPFPMSVLEAASLGLPLVVTDSCGLAGPVNDYQAGIVTNDSVGGLVDALRSLLSNQGLRSVTGLQAQQMAAELFSMDRVAELLIRTYEEARHRQQHD